MSKHKEQHWFAFEVTYKGLKISAEGREEGGVEYTRIQDTDGEWTEPQATTVGNSPQHRRIALEMCRGVYGKE